MNITSIPDDPRSGTASPPLDLQLLRKRYQELNASFARTRLQQLGTGGGFCAETLGLLKAMISCATSETRLVVATHPHGRGFALGDGWGDYFVDIFPTKRGRRFDLLNRSRYPAHSYLPDRIVRAAQATTRRLMRADLLQFDPPRLPERITIPGLGIDLDWWQGFKLCVDLIWELQPEVATEVARLRKTFGATGPYTGVHIRRGDKREEAEYVAAQAYANAILERGGVPNRVLVASDDMTAPPALAALLGPSYMVSSVSIGQGGGYSQAEFNDLPPRDRRALTVRFLAEFETLRDSTVLFTTTSSNVGCLLQYARAAKGIVNVF